jgi:phenylacetate-CoA ligase
MSTPSFAEALIESYPKITGNPVSKLGIKKLLLSGEPGVAIPSIRKRMEEAFGGKWNDYLMINSEGFCSSCTAKEYQGLHEVALDLSIWSDDLIDLDTKKRFEKIADFLIGISVKSNAVCRNGNLFNIKPRINILAIDSVSCHLLLHR